MHRTSGRSPEQDELMCYLALFLYEEQEGLLCQTNIGEQLQTTDREHRRSWMNSQVKRICCYILTWIEFRPRPWPWGVSHGTISISGGSGWLQRLHSETVGEEIWMELSARPQLKGEERRAGKSWSLEHLPGKALCPKGGSSSIHRHLSSSHGEAGMSVITSTEGLLLRPRTLAGASGSKWLRVGLTPDIGSPTSKNSNLHLVAQLSL